MKMNKHGSLFKIMTHFKDANAVKIVSTHWIWYNLQTQFFCDLCPHFQLEDVTLPLKHIWNCHHTKTFVKVSLHAQMPSQCHISSHGSAKWGGYTGVPYVVSACKGGQNFAFLWSLWSEDCFLGTRASKPHPCSQQAQIANNYVVVFSYFKKQQKSKKKYMSMLMQGKGSPYHHHLEILSDMASENRLVTGETAFKAASQLQ